MRYRYSPDPRVRHRALVVVCLVSLGLVLSYLLDTLLLPEPLALSVPEISLYVQPRNIASIPGILFNNFIHEGFDHFYWNVVALLVYGGALALLDARVCLQVTLLGLFVPDLIIWLTAHEQLIAFGSSDISAAYKGALLLLCYAKVRTERDPWFMLGLGFLSAQLFPTLMLSLGFGQAEGVSLYGHMLGLVLGIVVAALARVRHAIMYASGSPSD